MERKSPFGPEEKTIPSRRNPVLEATAARSVVSVSMVEVAPAPHRPRASAGRPADRSTDDAAGPSTPRPRLSLATVPRVLAGLGFIRALPLGPRDAFLLAHLDGESDLGTLVDVTGMTRLEVCLILEKLVDLGVVELA